MIGNPVIIGANGGTNTIYGATGINNSAPGYTLDVAGRVKTSNDSPLKPNAGSWHGYSDRRLKKNVRVLADALDTITRLQGVHYDWINPSEHSGSTNVGFIAQDVESVFPEWTGSARAEGADRELIPAGEDARTLGLPIAFDAYVVEALRELRDRNEFLEQQLWTLKALVCSDHPEARTCNE